MHTQRYGDRERVREGRLTTRLGGVANAWQTEMMIAEEASSLLASISARCPWRRYSETEAAVGGGLSELREDTGVWRQHLRTQT